MTPLQREAYDWVKRLASGAATKNDAVSLQQWCDRSEAHAQAFADAKRFWKTLATVGTELRDDESRAAAHRRVVSRRMMLGGALAASLAAVAVIRPPLELWPSIFELDADYRTGTGEQREIAIPNIAAVQMNTRTSLSVKGDPAERTIELVSGEASFRTVLQEKSFSVLAAGGRTLASGARFDVRTDGTSVCVTCLSDSVEIEAGARAMHLQRQQRVTYQNGAFGDVVAVDPAIAGAWREGLIICRNTALSDVVIELNRYRSGRIVLMRSELANLPVSGRFRIAEPDQALLQIQRVFGVRLRSLPGGLVLIG